MADFLYIHIPFCVRKCIYCDFISIPYEESLANDYADALCAELRLRKDSAGELRTVYFGGGTPSIMPEFFFEEIFSCIRGTFAVSPSAEITVEANPGAINETKMATLLSLGVNRVSIGVQSLQDDELRILGRVHTSGEALSSIKLVRETGVGNISVDLMYGIPGQTLKTWRESLHRTMELCPSHISAYELTPEEGTPLYGLLKRGALTLPDEGLVLEMYDAAIEFLYSEGYEHYEISNFARPGFRCLHNMNYWDRGEYIAAGTGAHSFLKGRRAKNDSDVRTYIERLKEGMSPLVETTEVTPEESVREFIFLGLRKREGIDLRDDRLRETAIASQAEGLVHRGYLEIVDDRLRLTRKGLVLSNSIIVDLFERLRL